jgi:2-polyprenyl-3-methyl-5-hydroxy-6-metoxy-1,4-benzoquinol methylase
MASESVARGRSSHIATAVRAAITAGPPKEVGYGEENLGRYVHTVEWLLARAGPAGGRLLDVGIYPGHLALALQAALGAEVSGVGRFVPPVFRTGMAARGIPVEDVDLEHEFLPFADGTFDRVLATEILEHLDHPGLLLGECLRVLRPRGTLFLTTPNVVDLSNRLHTVRGRSPQSHLVGIDETFRMNEWVHRREYAPDEVARLLGAVGFEGIDIHTFTPPPDGPGGRWRAWVARVVNRVPGLGGTVFAAAEKPVVPSPSGRVDRARLALTPGFLEIEPGATAALGVQATNVGNATWPAEAPADPVAFGMHLLDVNGRTLDRDFARRALTRSVDPGETIEQTFPFEAPIVPGIFILEVDLVREGQHWFGDDASPTARVVLRVRA